LSEWQGWWCELFLCVCVCARFGIDGARLHAPTEGAALGGIGWCAELVWPLFLGMGGASRRCEKVESVTYVLVRAGLCWFVFSGGKHMVVAMFPASI
jgi:hypothetical protein